MLLTSQVVRVCTFRVERLLTCFTSLLESCSRRRRRSSGLVRDDSFRERLSSQRWQRGYPALQIVSMPIRLHMRSLQFAGSEGNATSVARVEWLLATIRRCWLCESRHVVGCSCCSQELW